MNRLNMRVLLAVVCLSWLLPSAAATPDAAAQAEAGFASGVQAFRDGDYPQALQAFERARSAGLDTPNLHYNLGVTCYRLARYAQARREFEHLARLPELAPLAHYNLGLVALKQNAVAEARRQFDSAATTAQDPKLRALAQSRLAELGPAPAAARLYGFVDAGVGYDDNVVPVPDPAVVAPSGKGDTFTEFMGGIVAPISGDADSGLRLKASALWLDYADLNEFDQVSLRGGLAWRQRMGVWQTELYGFGDLIWLDNDPFERIATLSYEAVRPLGDDLSMRLRARAGYIDADPAYDSLTGWRSQLLAEARRQIGAVGIRGGYEFEYNDRNDVDTGAEFFSVSPLRHRLFLKADRKLAAAVDAYLSADYRYSRYRDPDRSVSGGVMTENTREETRYKLGAGLDFYLSRDWMLSAEYQYLRNESNLDAFDYTSNQVMGRIERLF